MKYVKTTFALAITTLCCLQATAQPTPAQLHMQQQADIINQNAQFQQMLNNRSANDAAAQAEADRQWWEEENRIQADIRRLRKKPFYGAILVETQKNGYMGGGGYSSKELAIQMLMQKCSSMHCKVITTFANTCAMVAAPAGSNFNPQSISIAFDNDGEKAIDKAYYACEARHGKGNCRYGGLNKEGNGSGPYAYCSGYDYGVYKE